ncbi:MAG: hypothetical protein R3C17_15900 [Planctomycetaceae bacterium]
MIQTSLASNSGLSQGSVEQDRHRLRLSGDSPVGHSTKMAVLAMCADMRHEARLRVIFNLQVLICAGLLVAGGCRQESGPTVHSEADAAAQREALLKSFPAPAPDSPEQIQQKEATVAESLPKVYELLEQAKTDPAKTDAAVELSMSLVALLPSHREATVAWCKAQLASFLAKEATDSNGKIVDAYNMAVAIRSAASGARIFKEKYEPLSDEEVQLFHEIFFNMARLEGLDHQGEGATESFNEALRDLMSLGFSDVERLKAEPRFKGFFANPKTAAGLQAAIAQMEASKNEVPAAGTSEADASPPTE